MLRSLVALGAVAVLAGCGAVDGVKGSRGPEPCPAGAPELFVRDILPEPPPGTEIVAADPKTAKPIVDELRQETGEAVRSIRTRVVAEPDREYGTLLLLLNTDERTAGRDFLAGAKEGAKEVDAEVQDITIAGEEGALILTTDGAAAVGAVGDCTGLALYAATEAEVRAVAERIRQPE
jgi:hypothetical protein